MTTQQYAHLRRMFPWPNREAERITRENGKVPGRLEAQCVMGMLIGGGPCFEFNGIRPDTSPEDAVRQFRDWMSIGVQHGNFSREDAARMTRCAAGALGQDPQFGASFAHILDWMAEESGPDDPVLAEYHRKRTATACPQCSSPTRIPSGMADPWCGSCRLYTTQM